MADGFRFLQIEGFTRCIIEVQQGRGIVGVIVKKACARALVAPTADIQNRTVKEMVFDILLRPFSRAKVLRFFRYPV